MKTEDIIVEVKTEWEPIKDHYTRQVIEYNCLPPKELTNMTYAVHFIKEINHYAEITQKVINNKKEIRILKANTKQEINERNDFINSILEYTKKQWNIGE